MKHEPNNTYSTEECHGYATKHDFGHKKMHSVDCITDYHIDYFDKGQIAFKVFGYPFYKGSYDAAVPIVKNAVNDPRMNAAEKEKAVEAAHEHAIKRQSTKSLAHSDTWNDERVVVGTTGGNGAKCCTIF